MRTPFLVVAMSFLLTACSVVGVRSGTEQPPYEVTRQLANDVEIRRYGPRLAAETLVPAGPDARNAAFRRLAGYIFGGNAGAREIAMTAPVATSAAPDEGTKIAMTAPVATAASDDQLLMRFFLPAALTRATAPTPKNANVCLVEVPAETLAVLRFSGRPTDARVRDQEDRLRAFLRDAGIESTGSFEAFFYDPPWTVPALRRNEVAVPVAVAAP